MPLSSLISAGVPFAENESMSVRKNHRNELPRVSQTSVLGLDAIEMPGKLREIQVWEPNVRPTRSEFRGRGFQYF